MLAPLKLKVNLALDERMTNQLIQMHWQTPSTGHDNKKFCKVQGNDP